MVDHSREVKTLIICFVFAIMVLIPLRFVEERNMANKSQTRVLGEEVVLTEEIIGEDSESEIILPNAEVSIEEE